MKNENGAASFDSEEGVKEDRLTKALAKEEGKEKRGDRGQGSHTTVQGNIDHNTNVLGEIAFLCTSRLPSITLVGKECQLWPNGKS